MARLIFRAILLVAAILGIFFLGGIFSVANSTRHLAETLILLTVISVGYLLGKNSK